MTDAPSTATVATDAGGSALPAVTASAQVTGPGLSSRERAMLDFERQWWRRAGAKETAIRDLFEVAPTRYYQVLNALVERPEALAADPLLVRRLRRVRATRQRTRSSRGPGH